MCCDSYVVRRGDPATPDALRDATRNGTSRRPVWSPTSGTVAGLPLELRAAIAAAQPGALGNREHRHRGDHGPDEAEDVRPAGVAGAEGARGGAADDRADHTEHHGPQE